MRADRGLPEAANSLATLCEVYWYPIYALIRRKGTRRGGPGPDAGLLHATPGEGQIAAADREKGGSAPSFGMRPQFPHR